MRVDLIPFISRNYSGNGEATLFHNEVDSVRGCHDEYPVQKMGNIEHIFQPNGSRGICAE